MLNKVLLKCVARGEKWLLKKVLKSKRGISPILATLLLIVIAVAAIIVTYAWITTYMRGSTMQAGIMLDVENVYWDNNAKKTFFYVKNIGTSDATIVRLWMGNTSNNLVDVTNSTNIRNGIVVPAGGNELRIITLNWSNPVASEWESNKLYHFKIVPSIGEEKYFTARAPSG